MRKTAALFAAAVLAAVVGGMAYSAVTRLARTFHPVSRRPIIVPGPDGNARILHNGWRIMPAGHHVGCADLPLGGSVSPDGRLAVIANCGYNRHAVHVLDLQAEKEIATVAVPRAWAGAAWAPDGSRFYVSGGLGNTQASVYVCEKDAGGGWVRTGGLKLEGAPERGCVSALAAADGILYALDLGDGCLYTMRLSDGSTLYRTRVATHPVACGLSPNKDSLYVADWGRAEVVRIALFADKEPRVAEHWRVGSHPNALAATSDGRLFVSCGNDDVVCVLDAASGDTLERIRTSLAPQDQLGSTPNALAVAGGRLYVANADNNDVCVVDVSRRAHSRVLGFIPTGWYPSAVLAGLGGSKIVIGSGKGSGTLPNPARLPLNPIVPTGFEYIGRQLNGLLSFVKAPTERELATYTKQVVACTPRPERTAAQSAEQGAVPRRAGQKSPIRYVLYVIKENRTYDQVFGDLPQGNGDPTLCLFGREVTPNQHALAEEFVLLDNLYCNGEVSQDGHPWSTMAYATDYTQRAWVLGYSGKGTLPDSVGMDVSSSGFLWEACKRHGISYRSYGEYATHPTLEGHSCLEFIGKAGTGNAPPGRDTERAEIFLREFRQFERTGTMPRFMVMSLGENHTKGTLPGAYTPKAMVASNDLAVGKIVEAVSHSSLWKEFVIFIIEDDAQNGPDHIDSHRTAGLVISPYVRRRSVDSTMYSTASMLRTMELILGLPPMTQYDAKATPMYACFTSKPDLRPFRALPARIDLSAKNPAMAYGAAISARMDWSEYDRIDEDALNRVLWHSIKGAQTPYPGAVRSSLVSN